MKRTLLLSALGLLAILLVMVVLVQVEAGDAEPLPAPDAAQPITLPDGEVVPLADLLARLRDEPAGTVEPIAPPDGTDAAPDAATREAELRAAELVAGRGRALYPGMGWGPVFRLAEFHRQQDDPDQALALYLSIEPSDPDYGHAQRRIGWDILTLSRGDPGAGVAYVQRALLAEPGDGNSWQDVGRVYARTLGLPVD